jgi:stage V sporulation protein R
MELISQHTKRIMERSKERARDAGLRFHDETLEYIVTNKDLLELSPKVMIPTLYDYWVHDVEVLREKGRYELYPENPYETVINTRPAISFYNDNNPDWLNVMIFYHVLAHVDFFQNNMLFKHTWDKDFSGQALSDKRFIAMLRSEKGRWVDYVIEFTRGVDNLVGIFRELSTLSKPSEIRASNRLDFYFDVFLQDIKNEKQLDYIKEIDRYNNIVRQFGEISESVFFADAARKYPEFEALFQKQKDGGEESVKDLIQYLQLRSPFLQKEENRWMKPVMEIVRKTSLFFQPQIRTKILNEGWASYWHDKLFLEDDRIRGHEVDYARINAKVTALPRAGLNPYALGMRLFDHIENLSNKGRLSYEFQRLESVHLRREFDTGTGAGRDSIFHVRENFDDFMFINTFLDQDFVDRHRLFVLGKRLNSSKGVWEYYVKSRNAAQYRQMMLGALYHPPCIEFETDKDSDNCIYLNHRFEGKPLVKDYIFNTMLGISYLWGGPVKLETSERVGESQESSPAWPYSSAQPDEEKESSYCRVLYSMADRRLSRTVL